MAKSYCTESTPEDGVSQEIDVILSAKKLQLYGKRLFDVVVSFFGIAALSPLFLALMAATMLDSGGGAFFTQPRVGKDGKIFNIIKFRTMTAALPGKENLPLTVANDARITRIGKILRKTKLDELPQLVNVLAGDMSFVGPRPEVPRYTALYDSRQRNVLKIKPGITDIASIKYRNENELLNCCGDPETFYINEIMPEKIDLSINYIHRQSIFFDIQLILMTLFGAEKHGE